MRIIRFLLEDYERFGGWEHMPKRELLSVVVNPYNGVVHVKYSDRRENAVEVIEQVISQLNRDLHALKMQDVDNDFDDLADCYDGLCEIPRPQVVSVPRKGRGVAAAGNMAKVG